MIDTHCHLDFPVFDGDREAVWARARDVGVRGLVIPGVRLDSFGRILALRGEGCRIAFGLHPVFWGEHPEDALAQLEGWVRWHAPVAVGEIGLDYMVSSESFEVQARLFEGQLRLAKAFHLPVLLHVRRAHEPVLALLRQVKFPCGGIVHAFSGSLEQARAYIRLGFCVGIGGVVTRGQATRVRQVAARVDAASLVLESDAPDLPPLGRIGERNEPACLGEVVATLAALRGVEVADLILATTRNARRVLNWQE
ncbi:MAG: TatD family hydrolase [Magnetococcales bacterium]|nr:TatD family hydrolase [Magnetococcales bacterium]